MGRLECVWLSGSAEEHEELEDEAESETVEQLDLQCFTACLESGMSEEQVSNVVQTEVCAFVAVGKATKGKSKGGKSSGKDKGG